MSPWSAAGRAGSHDGQAAADGSALVAAAAPHRMPSMRPLVVIPTYNESENIERMLLRIRECLPAAGILVVDDGSPDGTALLVEKLSLELADVHLLRGTPSPGSAAPTAPGSPGVSSAATTRSSK